VGLSRVGPQVRAEGGGGLMGFPLFLPRAPTVEGATGGIAQARRLDVRIEATDQKPSYAPRLYAAARKAVDRFGPIVAEVSISAKTHVQDAVTVVDYLYRAGCAAVKLKYRMVVKHREGPSIPQIWIQERLLPETPLPVQIPSARPRKAPWAGDGAAQPGAFDFLLEDIAEPGAAPREGEAVRRPLPNYAATGQEVPAAARALAAQEVKAWANTLGAWLREVLAPGRVSFPAGLLVKRRQQSLGVKDFFAEARGAFPKPDRVVPATLRVQGYAFQGGDAVGKVDVTLDLTGPGLDVVYASWVVEKFPRDLVLPPAEADPYAAGKPGSLRVWIEGLLAAARARGPAVVPLASEARVLAQLPRVAHAGVRAGLARRPQTLEYLAGWLRATPYDRLLIAAVDGQASVWQGGRIVGVLRYAIAGEAGRLALSALHAKVAPR
ncbi:MAG: hypothetical protein ACC662_08180, partial [Planctomycetota bacterium]